jgi:hypothetical protein
VRFGAGATPAFVGSGDITLAAGGNVQFNSNASFGSNIRTTGDVNLQATATGGQITQGAISVILANKLTTTSNSGTSLVGANNIGSFAATNIATGGVTLNNTSSLLTVTGISQTSTGALVLNQTGNLAFTGNVASGAQTISATENITVAAGGTPLSLIAAGPQTIIAGGTLGVIGGSAANTSAEIIGGGPVNITVGNELTLMGGSGKDAHALLFSNANFDLTIGTAIKLNAGTGKNAWAKVQTSSKKALINLFFPNLAGGGYFVNDEVGKINKGSTGFFNDKDAAKPGKTFFTDYGL